MKAARIHRLGTPPVVEDIPEPKLRPGSAIVAVRAALVAPSVADMYAEDAGFVMPPCPFTPGMDAVGVIERVADDVSGLEPGQTVYCDPYLESLTNGAATDYSFIGGFGMASASAALLRHWGDGAFAEKLLLPAECFTALGAAEAAGLGVLCRLGWIGTAFGGLLRTGLRAGESVAVAGATGLLGSSAVMLCLAMGAGRVVALGRNETVLNQLSALGNGRVVPVRSADLDQETGRHPELRDVDVVLDTVGETNDRTLTRAGLRALRRGGRAAILGGVVGELPVPYTTVLLKELNICGSIWFPRRAAADLLTMIGRGVLSLDAVRVTPFALDDVGSAINEAARHRGLAHVVLEPIRSG